MTSCPMQWSTSCLTLSPLPDPCLEQPEERSPRSSSQGSASAAVSISPTTVRSLRPGHRLQRAGRIAQRIRVRSSDASVHASAPGLLAEQPAGKPLQLQPIAPGSAHGRLSIRVDPRRMVKRIAAAIASVLMIGAMVSGCKTGEDLVLPNQHLAR